jgi:hypothetical protein
MEKNPASKNNNTRVTTSPNVGGSKVNSSIAGNSSYKYKNQEPFTKKIVKKQSITENISVKNKSVSKNQ